MYEFEQELMSARWERQDRLDHKFRIETLYAHKFVFVTYGLAFLVLNIVPVALPFRDWLTGHISLAAMMLFYVGTLTKI